MGHESNTNVTCGALKRMRQIIQIRHYFSKFYDNFVCY
jgi:hypothetical protein